MSTPATSVVLVTGATGYIGSATVLKLVKEGYRVKGTVRSQEKADAFTKKYPNTSQQIEWSVVEDITRAGAFDRAAEGVDHVIHVASPFHYAVTDNEHEMLRPAVEGTRAIFKAALKQPTVKTLVVTSSFAAIIDIMQGYREGHTYTEKDWNPATWDEAAKAPISPFVYAASKKLQEKALWDLVEANKPHFSVTAICPPMVYGPPFQVVESMAKLNTSLVEIWTLMNGTTSEVPPTYVPVYTDVRDVATLLVQSLSNAKAQNQRYLAIAGHFCYNQIASFIAKEFPDLSGVTPSDGTPPPPHFATDTSKVETDFGIKWISFEQCIKDTAEVLIAMQKGLKA